MVKKAIVMTSNSNLPTSYDPTAKYRIKVKRPVKVGMSFTIRPHQDAEVQGWVAEQISDAIASAERIA